MKLVVNNNKLQLTRNKAQKRRKLNNKLTTGKLPESQQAVNAGRLFYYMHKQPTKGVVGRHEIR